MEMHRVLKEEADIAINIMKDTALWLQSKGSQQWSDVLEGTDKHDLKGAVQRGDVYFFTVNQKIVGMAAVWNTPTLWDQKLWKVSRQAEKIFYIHRLIVHPDYRGLNYGTEMLKKIKVYFESIAVELRLDCISSNKKLIYFYRNNGFTNKGSIKISETDEFELFSQLLNE
ncbi:GNAT family N-acetyltransferase [Enterococcus sp. BWT-B8]|uniref:GNAT family N-acetyltransferase n=1 Tax=unclassified Enterococcus TaxID=2608891 RepID=UPI001E59605D|nr:MULTISPECIES: GNAT family N-acetyltransferase [unclassified Enterococcus]MCB5951499.1 GNAT family N-acetyltransferase [Enterococcus sp. BWT-B8]MCB5956427.1 GNAT family N-acetyltransferase [Enterococcus sp. CWB-B31]